MNNEEKKNRYYNSIMGYIEPGYKSKTINCKDCNEEFYYINSKKELLEIIEKNINEENNFGYDMVKLMTKFYYPGADQISFHEEKQICSCCYIYRDKKPWYIKCFR